MKLVQARHYTPANRTKIDLVVIHDMEYPERPTGAEWCAEFFAGPQAPKASAHFCVDNDSIVQCVLEKDIAWHAPGANHNGIGIEHAGYARQSAEEWRDEYSSAMLERSAELVADICKLYAIPIARPSVPSLKMGARGIVGHKDCTDAFSEGKGHYDPGPGFPWAWYLDRVRFYAGVPQTITTSSDRPRLEDLVEVWHEGVRWLVSPIQIPFVGIGQAAQVAARLGCELPTPALVDTIWRAADLKLDPSAFIQTHNGTIAEMDGDALRQNVIAATAENVTRPYKLCAGAFKDVVRIDGKPGLYGWHVENVETFNARLRRRLGVAIPTHAPKTPGLGRVVQPPFTGHALAWRDYSQGLRLCMRSPT